MNVMQLLRPRSDEQHTHAATTDAHPALPSDLASSRLPARPVRTVELDQVNRVSPSVLSSYLEALKSEMDDQLGIRSSMLGYQQQVETKHVEALLGSDGIVPAKLLEANRQKILADLGESHSIHRSFDGMRSSSLDAQISILNANLSVFDTVYGQKTRIYIVENPPADLAGVSKLNIKTPDGKFTYNISERDRSVKTQAYLLEGYDGARDTGYLKAIVFLKAS